MSKPKTKTKPRRKLTAAQREAVSRARMMAGDAAPMLRNRVSDLHDVRHRIASMAEMAALYIEREVAAHPVNKVIDPGLTPLEKIKAVVLQIHDATGEVAEAAEAVDFWAKEIMPLSRKWRREATGGAA